MGLRILAVGAHPDDWEVGAGGLLQRAEEIYVLIATRGERGGDPVDREQEARAALELLGAQGTVLLEQDTAVNAARLAPQIEAAIRSFRPRLILTLSPNDVHQDHAATSAATMIAARDFLGTVLGYSTPSVAERFRPNWFEGLTEAEMARKLDLVRCHRSQAGRPYLAPDYLQAAGRYWAQVTRSAAPFVEPFELLRHREEPTR